MCNERNIYRPPYKGIAYGVVAFVTLQATYECHCIYPSCVFLFVAEHINKRFPSNCLLIWAVIVSICFLKLFVYMCQVSCSNTAVACVDSAQWRLPPRSTTSCSAVSSSAPCTFLIQHLWVVSWLASPETWMRVGLICLDWEPFPQESSQSLKSPLLTRYTAEFFAWGSSFLLFTSTVSLLDMLIFGLLIWLVFFLLSIESLPPLCENKTN